MKHKRTGILVIIFLVLGLYVYYFESDQGNKEEVVNNKVEKALDFNVGAVREIVLRDHEQGVLLQKIDGQWKTKQREEFDFKHEKVTGVLTIFDLGIVRVIDPNPSDISLYGLDRPRYTLGIKVAGEDGFQTLIIGDDSPGNLSCYGTVRGQSSVLLLGIRYRQEIARVLKYVFQALDQEK